MISSHHFPQLRAKFGVLVILMTAAGRKAQKSGTKSLNRAKTLSVTHGTCMTDVVSSTAWFSHCFGCCLISKTCLQALMQIECDLYFAWTSGWELFPRPPKSQRTESRIITHASAPRGRGGEGGEDQGGPRGIQSKTSMQGCRKVHSMRTFLL